MLLGGNPRVTGNLGTAVVRPPPATGSSRAIGGNVTFAGMALSCAARSARMVSSCALLQLGTSAVERQNHETDSAFVAVPT